MRPRFRVSGSSRAGRGRTREHRARPEHRGSDQTVAIGELAAEFGATGAGSYGNTLGGGAVQYEHEGGSERSRGEAAGLFPKRAGRRHVEVSRVSEQTVLGIKAGHEVAPARCRPLPKGRRESRRYGLGRRYDFGFCFVAGDLTTPRAPVGIGVAGVEPTSAELQVMDEGTKVDGRGGAFHPVLVFHPYQGFGRMCPRSGQPSQLQVEPVDVGYELRQ